MSLNVIFDNGRHKIETSGRRLNQSELARLWRNSELERTDEIMKVPDHPEKVACEAYRQALRDWPSTPDFPLVKPTL